MSNNFEPISSGIDAEIKRLQKVLLSLQFVEKTPFYPIETILLSLDKASLNLADLKSEFVAIYSAGGDSETGNS
jgi:hypothetical protein